MISQLYSAYLNSPKISTDTRVELKGSIFFALKGENYDANNFVKNAVEKGAELVVTQNESFKNHPKCFYTKDTLKTLQELATHHRDQLQCDVIGITGSNGKTTTKELIKYVLSSKFRVFSTIGNFNNHIGLPLSILSINDKHEKAIIEMGANHVGEIATLCQIAKPSHGVITNIGEAHLEGFKTIENIIRTKLELYDYLQQSQGYIFHNQKNKNIPIDDYRSTQVIEYGGENSFVSVKVVSCFPLLKISWTKNNNETICQSQLFGDFNSSNILVAIAMGIYWDINSDDIKTAIEGYTPSNNRSQITNTKTNTLIIDAYNANPTSMKLALKNFGEWEVKSKVAIIGTMNELGKATQEEHQKIVEMCRNLNFNKTIFIGRFFKNIKPKPNELFFHETDECIEFIKRKPLQHKHIFLKASRNIQLEKLVACL